MGGQAVAGRLARLSPCDVLVEGYKRADTQAPAGGGARKRWYPQDPRIVAVAAEPPGGQAGLPVSV
jgi:hypothetical protein